MAGTLMPDGTPSDGCTAWPDGDWEDCCRDHDVAYRSGHHGFAKRRRADLHLLTCVAKKGYPGLAVLMFLGVRAFGWVPFHQNYRRWVGTKAQQVAKRAVAALVVLMLASCSANVTTTRISRGRDGAVQIQSGKDITFRELVWVENGVRIEVRGYSSNVNVDAVRAQDERERALRADTIDAIKAGIAVGAKAVTGAVLPVP